ncbi:IS1 family transposase [Candidatus Neptunichlamydia sp. REUL1]|uniref:IS1 family transposase n=1 Tax=Candidatus Neptunichlamydia sp. REUL1 TaxID=3064277 RepID=UPI00292EABB9|nr:IS1 family transposase [Candidatus Neptunochlamydia sp. REUL1]
MIYKILIFLFVQKNKLWTIKALDRASRKTVASVLGRRSATTFRKLYGKVSRLTECLFFTNDWSAFAKVLPKDRHVIGKSGTIAIEQDNSTTRHHLGRMTRRRKVVFKTKKMVDTTIKLW